MNSFCIKLISSQLVCVHREFLNGVPKTGFSIALDDASANFKFYLNQSIAKMHYTGIPRLVRFFGPQQTALLEKPH